MNKFIKKLSVVLFIASVAGVIVSSLGMYDDVMSTSHTLRVYFPVKFGVTPSSTENGNIRLGVFVTAIQIVSAAVVMSEQFSRKYRVLAFVLLLTSAVFDAWTDIVFRSGYLTGNIAVATTTTIAFYTFGTEILNGFSLALISFTWRQAIADIAWGVAYTLNSLSTFGSEWTKYWGAAKRRAANESQRRVSERETGTSFYQPSAQPNTINSAPSQQNYPSHGQASRSRRMPTYHTPSTLQRPTSEYDSLAKLGLKRASSLEEPEYEDLV